MAVARIDVFSHNFKVSKYQREFYLMLKEYCRPLIQTGLEPRPGGRFVPTMLKVFAASNGIRTEMRFSISLLRGFFEWCRQRGYTKEHFVVVEHPRFTPKPLISKFLPSWELRDYQIPVVDFCVDPEETIRVCVVQTGKGKANSVNSLVKVPGGWCRMGDIKVGDIVTAWDGTPTRVIGVFPQGRVETFKVTFVDGRSTIVTEDHLWQIFYVNTTPARRWRVVNTKEIARLLNMPNPRVYIPLCESEATYAKQLPIAPYLLGALLGDGGFTTSSVVIRKPDQELFDRLSLLLPTGDSFIPADSDHCLGYRIKGTAGRNATVTSLREMGLLGVPAWEKSIPDEYLNASTEQRWSLLQGLMDTDGTVNTRASGGATSFCSTSKILATQVQYLVRSLGGIASISTRTPHYSHGGEKKKGRLAFIVNIRVKRPSKLFQLSRKQERTNDKNQYAEGLKLRVVSVESNGLEEAQCISIDHPDRLYVTDDFIVTHNTFMAMKSAEKVAYRTIVIVPAMYTEKWYEDIKGMFKDVTKRMLMVKGFKQLCALTSLAKADALDADFIIVSATTMQIFIRNWEQDPHVTEEMCCHPEEFYEVVGAGTKVIDELHKGIHLNIKMDLYTNIPKSIYLTATIRASNPFINRMTEMAYPVEHRYKGLAYDKYIGVIAMEYRLQNPKAARWTGKKREYSQTVYEGSIMRNKRMLDNYTVMVEDLVQDTYIDVMETGQTCIVFAGSIDMCTHLAKALKRKYPHLKVGRYVGEDDYEVLMSCDIVVSTILSAGTAIDKAGLITVLMTVAVDSIQANEQTMGRLRRLKDWPDLTPKFYYLVCASIDKHITYHKNKVELLSDKALWQRYEILQHSI